MFVLAFHFYVYIQIDNKEYIWTHILIRYYMEPLTSKTNLNLGQKEEYIIQIDDTLNYSLLLFWPQVIFLQT